ncbi:hypothetical protein CW304_04390 [Bacillus sp. UFRGS-B20]|nr:hypothetical protein CW304_04390 [Bacillus sp. UFRGS-B20]
MLQSILNYAYTQRTSRRLTIIHCGYYFEGLPLYYTISSFYHALDFSSHRLTFSSPVERILITIKDINDFFSHLFSLTPFFKYSTI